MYDAGSLRRLGPAFDRPGSGFLGTSSEKSDQVEQLVASTDQAIETGVIETDRGKIFPAFAGRQRRNFRLYLRRDDDAGRAFLFGARLDCASEFVSGGGRAL